MTLVRNLQALRQRAVFFAGSWRAAGIDVITDQDERVAVAVDTNAAQYLADIHNLFLPLVNNWLMARKALRDRREMAKQMAER